MMQRSVAVADLEPIGGGDGRGDVGLGLLRRGDEIAALGEPGRDRRRQRAAGAVGIFGGDAFGRQAHDLALPDQQIDAFSAVAVAAFDQHIARAERQDLARLHFHFAFVARERGAGQRGGLRQIGRHHQRKRNEFAAQRRDRVGRQQPVAGGRDHHRIEHDVLGLMARAGPPPPP